MRTHLDCIPCFLSQALRSTRLVSSDEAVAERVMRRTLEATCCVRMDLPPPHMGRQVHRIIREETGCADPFAVLKQKSTEMALGLADLVARRITESSNSFDAAVRFSIAGNVMDYALASEWKRDKVESCVDEALSKPLENDALNALEESVKEANDVLVIGDNAGETVFDRLLIERLPEIPRFYAVKGAPVINDAIREDAEAAGIDRVARIVETGSDAPGTILDLCEPSFRALFESTDLVIAKGQANLETLHGCGRELFVLTQVKCPVIARDIDAEVGDWLVEHWNPSSSSSEPSLAHEVRVTP